MKKYMNFDTGEVFTEEEMTELWEQFKSEMRFKTFQEFLDNHKEIDCD